MKHPWYLTYLICFIGINLFLVRCDSDVPSIDLENYEPCKEFTPAYQALRKEQVRINKTYDIEETVRIMNGLEVAQTQSDDFFSFLEYMAKQDYTFVAQEVIEAKMKLLPILQRMFQLEKEYEKFSSIWIIARSLASSANSLNISDITGPTAMVGLPMAADKIKSATFEEYQKQQKIKSALKKEIEAVKMAYIEYLTEFSPIYYKYMKEWDKLCLNKDKAYLEAYSGRMEEAYSSASIILQQYPRNREALLLKSLALINMPSKVLAVPEKQLPLDISSFHEEKSAINKEIDNYEEAENTLANYIELYPERSAPALVLKGLLESKKGHQQQAISYFDQAAMEYPRQAALLKDLLDSYRSRTYLNKTPEGQYLLKLYRSTMEGYGMFSPNFLKANYYTEIGRLEESKNEIFNHFFRRGNQGIYDCLLSDMNYCEEYLYSSFKQLLMEQSFIDVSIEPTSDWKFSAKDDEIKVIINNRSDIKLENVRIFLCLHYTDMYKDEYDVVKVPSKNIINPHEEVKLDAVKLEYENKKYKDITRVRAIAMTDDKICWIDDAGYKQSHALTLSNTKQYDSSQRDKNTKKENFLKDFSLTANSLKNILEKEIGVQGGQKILDSSLSWYSWDKVKEVGSALSDLWDSSDKKLRIEMPRILTLIDPVFSIHQLQDKDKVILPEENYLAGSNIRLKFDYEPQEGETLPLYIYSDFINIKVLLLFNENKPSVKNVEIL